MASWYPDIEMEEMRSDAKGYGKERGAGPSSGVRGCIRPRHYTTSYRDTGEIKFCISEYKHDAFQVCVCSITSIAYDYYLCYLIIIA